MDQKLASAVVLAACHGDVSTKSNSMVDGDGRGGVNSGWLHRAVPLGNATIDAGRATPWRDRLRRLYAIPKLIPTPLPAQKARS